MVAGSYFEKNLNLLAQEGRLVHIASQKGEKVELSIRTLMSKCANRYRIHFATENKLRKSQDRLRKLKAKVWPLLEAGKIQVIVDQVFPLAEAADAHRRIEAGEHIGKVI